MGLPPARRLRRGPDVTAVLRRGRRARAGGLVVHGLVLGRDPDGAGAGAGADACGRAPRRGPRVAFVAPRTCGSAVRRNRTRRRVQEAVRAMVADGRLAGDVDLVVRLLPEATAATSPQLSGWLHAALRRLGTG